MKNIAIIPARSGSKGLKDKNIKLLNGKPLMWYSVNAAVDSGCFDEIMVSTDSEKYADIARECGADVPFLRSDRNSTDDATSADMIKEVIYKYKEMGQEYDTLTLLQPTSPLRTAGDIKNAYMLYREKNALSVVSVCETEHSPLWCNVLPHDRRLDGFIRPEVLNNGGRQKLETMYRINGAIYITAIDYDDYNFDKCLYNRDSYAYIMDQVRSIDIDTELDFIIAESIVKNMK